MGDIKTVLKENIKFYRKRRGLTQQGLAEACGVTTPYIGEIEIGRKLPSLSMVEMIAEVLAVPPWRLLLPPESRDEVLGVLLAEELKESVGRAVDEVLRRTY